MMVTVEIGGASKAMELPEDSTCIDLVVESGLSPDVTLVFFDGRPVPIDSPLADGRYRLVSVASGG